MGKRLSSQGVPSCTYNASNELNAPAPLSMGNSTSVRLGTVVSRAFTPVLAKHTKNFSLVHILAVGAGSAYRDFEPVRMQVEVRKSLPLRSRQQTELVSSPCTPPHGGVVCIVMGTTQRAARGARLRLIDVDARSFDALPCCGIKSPAHPGRQEKRCWLQTNARFGLRAKTLLTPDGEPSGYIEYIPGEFAWRGVDARGYMFIHCVWIYSRKHQRKGWGGVLVQACLDDARKAGMSGVVVMVRDGPWLADRRLFLANGFRPVDTAPPDYQLLVRKFSESAPNPAFKGAWERKVGQHGAGLTIIRSSQCPHIAKFAADIAETAEKEYHIKPKVIDLQSPADAQNAPTPYAVFSVIYDGQLLADHQISRTRFRNIMRKLGKRRPA